MTKYLITALAYVATSVAASAQSLPEAIKLTDKEQFQKAEAAFSALLSAKPDDAITWFHRGENFFDAEKLDSALFAYEHGMAANTELPLNLAGKAKVLRAQGKAQEADVLLERALTATTSRTNRFPKPMQSRGYTEVAAALLEGSAKDFAKAQAQLTKAIELDPKNARAYILRGDAYFEQNPRDGTTPLENYKEAIRLNPLDPKPLSRKAFMYYRANNFQAAIEDYTAAIAIDAGFAPAYRGRAEANLKARKFDQAAADMSRYLDINKGNVSARVRNAQFLFLVGKYQESLDEIAALESLGIKDLTLQRIKGYDLVELKDTANALPVLKAYFAEQASDKVLSSDHEYYGKALVLQGQDSAAAEAMLRGARMSPANDYLYAEAAKVFTNMRAFGRAADAYAEKIKVKPELNDWYFLGGAAYRAKQFGRSDSAWTNYITGQPNVYQGYLYRARARTGTDTADVKLWTSTEDYQKVLELMKPEDRERAKADYEEALNYMGLYYLYAPGVADRAVAKCYFLKVAEVNANTSITKQVKETFLASQELKDLKPADCGQ